MLRAPFDGSDRIASGEARRADRPAVAPLAKIRWRSLDLFRFLSAPPMVLPDPGRGLDEVDRSDMRIPTLRGFDDALDLRGFAP